MDGLYDKWMDYNDKWMDYNDKWMDYNDKWMDCYMVVGCSKTWC